MHSTDGGVKPPDEDWTIHCPKLGHQLPFSYCRAENMGAPCVKTLDCWYCYFPVEQFLRKELTAQEWTAAFEAPRVSKLDTLAEIIKKVANASKP